jgi:hypothetical protein
VKPDGEPSGLIVTGPTPSVDDYKLIVNEKGYAERVDPDDPRPAATQDQVQKALEKQSVESKTNTAAKFGIRQAPSVAAEYASPTIPLPGMGDGLLKVPLVLLKSVSFDNGFIEARLNESQMVELYEAIDTLTPPTSMKEIKVLVKLQEDIDRLLGRP